jgi:hypothetical protein
MLLAVLVYVSLFFSSSSGLAVLALSVGVYYSRRSLLSYRFMSLRYLTDLEWSYYTDWSYRFAATAIANEVSGKVVVFLQSRKLTNSRRRYIQIGAPTPDIDRQISTTRKVEDQIICVTFRTRSSRFVLRDVEESRDLGGRSDCENPRSMELEPPHGWFDQYHLDFF